MEQTVLALGEQVVVSDQSDDVVNPYDGSVVATVPACGSEHVDQACAVAEKALRRGLSQVDRAEILERAATLLRGRTNEFATTIALESGKPIRTAAAEVTRCADTLAFSAASCRTLAGEVIPLEASKPGQGRVGFTIVEPVGVVGAITPFNFPLNLVAHKVAPAIAAGCPVVLKPAELTPLSAIRLVSLLLEAGLPRDWVTVIPGLGPSAGGALVEHDVPRLITFTGSTNVGWEIARSAPRKKVLLELGSSAPLIVEPMTDLALIAKKVAVAGFSHAGQSCISTQRILVHSSVKAEFVDLLVTEVENLNVGDPMSEATDVGPLIHVREAERVQEWLAEAEAAGGRLATGGDRTGAIVTPAVVDDVPLDSRMWTSELFGPAVGVVAYDDFDQALELANDSDLTLQAGVWTPDVDCAFKAIRNLDFGGVLINEVPTYRADQQPYGGTKGSGNTREGPAYTIREMSKEKFVMFNG